jgi:hypothetical protein
MKQQKQQKQTQQPVTQGIKELFTEQFIQHSTFTQELYKKARRCTKKLEDIAKIEEKVASGKPINDAQREKLLIKDHLLEKAKQIKDTAELFKNSLEQD